MMAARALNMWVVPRIHVSDAVAVLRTRTPKRLTYLAPTGATEHILIEPGPRLDTLTVMDGARRDVVAIIPFTPAGTEQTLLLFACPGCNHGSELIFLRALAPDGQVVAPGPRCQTCSRLFDADGTGPEHMDGTGVHG